MNVKSKPAPLPTGDRIRIDDDGTLLFCIGLLDEHRMNFIPVNQLQPVNKQDFIFYCRCLWQDEADKISDEQGPFVYGSLIGNFPKCALQNYRGWLHATKSAEAWKQVKLGDLQ